MNNAVILIEERKKKLLGHKLKINDVLNGVLKSLLVLKYDLTDRDTVYTTRCRLEIIHQLLSKSSSTWNMVTIC